MRKRIVVATASACLLAALASGAQAARVETGIISSHYDEGRTTSRAASLKGRKSAAHQRQARRYATKTRAERVASKIRGRSVTAGHSGGGTSRSCLQPQAQALLSRIEQQFGAVRLVSTCRPGAVIAGSGKPSKHRYGLAIDFDAGARKGEIVKWLIANHQSGGTMTYANMSHVHVDVGPRFVALNSGGRRRG